MTLSDNINDLVYVVIRSAGERTEQLCKKLILEQGISPENICIVREAPFSAALEKSYEMGIEHGLKWTLCIDADVLLRPGAVEKMIALAEGQVETVCEIEGYILDKFAGGPRTGGIHLYRTSVLSKAIELIPVEGEDIRPENYTLDALEEVGYKWKVVPYLVGIHGFEQYYTDIYRTCFVHAHKHLDLTKLFLTIWRENANRDMDYVVALKGFASGVEYSGEVHIDSGQEVYQNLFSELPLQEKQVLELEQYSLASIEELINNWVEPKPYQEQYPTKFGLVPKVLTNKHEFRQKLTDFGFIMIIPYALGKVLQVTGKKLQDWVRSSRKPKSINWIKTLDK